MLETVFHRLFAKKRSAIAKREVYVNLWDDYVQKPEYDRTDPTFIYLEGGADSLTQDERSYLLDFILDLCNIWKKRSGHNEVAFGKGAGPQGERLNIVNLNTPERKSLFDYLQDCQPPVDDIRINWIMES